MVLSASALALLFLQCAPSISPDTLNPLIQTESGGNPFAVANVTDKTSRFFSNKETAIMYVNNLEKEGKNYSAGLMQINSANFNKYHLDNESVFDSCTNIKAGAKLLSENYHKQKENDEQLNLRKSLSLYYSGNTKTGFKKEKGFNNTSYIERVEQKAYDVPALKPSGTHAAETKSNPLITESWDVFGDFKK